MQALSCALRNKLGMIQCGQDPSRLAKQNLACYCERHISSITIEQRDAELPLKRANLHAQWRLRHSWTFRGASKVELFARRDEISQTAQIHDHSPKVLIAS